MERKKIYLEDLVVTEKMRGKQIGKNYLMLHRIRKINQYSGMVFRC
jgi:hypothetical protein